MSHGIHRQFSTYENLISSPAFLFLGHRIVIVTFFVFNRGKCFCGSSFIIAIAFWRSSSAFDLALFAENLEALSFLAVRCILLITAGRDVDGFKSDLTDALRTILLFLFPSGSKIGIVVVIVGAGTGLGTFAFPGKNKS